MGWIDSGLCGDGVFIVLFYGLLGDVGNFCVFVDVLECWIVVVDMLGFGVLS